MGVFLGINLFKGRRPLLRIWLGSVIGMLMFMWTNIPFSFIFGFTVTSHLCGLGLAVCITLGLFFWKHFNDRKKAAAIPEDAGDPVLAGTENEAPVKKGLARFFSIFTKDEWVMLIFIMVFMVFPALTLPSHTLRELNGAMYTGQCTYGDMNMHLGFITSIANQGTFPPEYSILPGEPLNYPFLCDSVSSSLYLFGTPLRVAYMLPMFFAFAQVFAGFWFLASEILKKTSKTALAFTFFFLNGGFGIIYFLDNLVKDPENFTRIFTAFYNTPTNLVNSGTSYSNIRWTNSMVDMMLPQRATLFGWVMLMAALWLLYTAVFENGGKWYFLAAGIVAGLIPMVHTHSYFAVGLIAVCWIIYSVIKNRFSGKIILSWAMFGIPALALSIPQLMLWTFNAVGESFVRFNYDWCNSTDNPIWFWVKNIGIVLLLLPAAFISADSKKKALYSGALLIFIIAEFIAFQPNTYDNNKLLLVWYILTAIIVADFCVNIYEKLKVIKGRVILAILLITISTNAALLSIAREVVSGERPYSYQLYGSDAVSACKWIEDNTEPDSLFLCNNNHNNAVASLTGRNIFCGAGTFLYFHGIGYSEKEAVLKDIFEGRKDFEDARVEYGIDYVYISSYERANYRCTNLISMLEAQYPVVYSKGEVTIYDVR